MVGAQQARRVSSTSDQKSIISPTQVLTIATAQTPRSTVFVEAVTLQTELFHSSSLSGGYVCSTQRKREPRTFPISPAETDRESDEPLNSSPEHQYNKDTSRSRSRTLRANRPTQWPTLSPIRIMGRLEQNGSPTSTPSISLRGCSDVQASSAQLVRHDSLCSLSWECQSMC